MAYTKTAAQSRGEIRAEIAPILAAWIEHAAKHGMESNAHPTVSVDRVGKNVIYWSARVEPRGVTQWTGYVIHSSGADKAKLGDLRDSRNAQDWAHMRLTDRQEENLENESWIY